MKTIAFVVFSFLFFASFEALGFSWQAVQKNNKGARLLEKDRAYEASQNLIDSLAHAPLQAETHLNLGLAYEKQGDLQKAYQEYVFSAEHASTPELRFQALFNAAHAQGELKNIPQALALYQQALDVNADSIEAKTNIELLLQQNQGGGKGESKEQKQGGQGESQDQNQQQQKEQKQNQQQQPNQQPRNQPQQFKSQDLTQDDVRRILEELKQQEEKVRAKDQEHGKRKEVPGGKEW